METAAAAPGYLTQPIRPLVNDGGRLEPSSLLAAEPPTSSPTPSFSDLLSIVNPLQHLPIIGPLYRHFTGDESHPAAKVIGGLLFGGPVGLVSSAFTAIFEQTTGKSVVETAFALVNGSPEDGSVAAQPPGTPPELAPASALSALPIAAALPPPAEPAAPAIQPSVSPLTVRPAIAGARDLAFYRNHAGTRLPAPGGTGAPTGAMAPSLPRLVTPVLGPEPATAPLPPAQAMPGFTAKMMQNLERYDALRTPGKTRAAALDRFE